MSSFTTGLPTLDRILGDEPQLIVLGARPGEGKSLFATKAARETVHLGGNVLYFSLEMSPVELHVRVNLESHAAGDGELIMDGSPAVDVAQIFAEAKRAIRALDHLDLIVIDYLQLVRLAPNRTPKAAMNLLLGLLAEFVKQERTTVLVLAQLNRTMDTLPGADASPGEFREISPHRVANSVLILQRLDDIGHKLTVWRSEQIAGQVLLQPDPKRFFDGLVERGEITDVERRQMEIRSQRRAIDDVLEPVLNSAGQRAWWASPLANGESMQVALEAGKWQQVSAAATKFASQLTPYL